MKANIARAACSAKVHGHCPWRRSGDANSKEGSAPKHRGTRGGAGGHDGCSRVSSPVGAIHGQDQPEAGDLRQGSANGT